ncbi:MAG: SUMF1/EgtB/PvdO family nonheme iron enzyme [Planctomycetales bacterium]
MHSLPKPNGNMPAAPGAPPSSAMEQTNPNFSTTTIGTIGNESINTPGRRRTQERLHPVGQKKPNNWGLRDMHGNASEWCRDWYAKKLQGGRDPHGPATGLEPVRRGGSCFRPVFEARSASRIESFPNREPETGFRLAVVRE